MKTDQRTRIDVEWLGLKRLAHYASTSELTIRGWMHLPVDPLPAVRVGGKILVRRSEADSWLARRETIGRHGLRRHRERVTA